ncbi:glycosyltransferase [Marisediminicola sp. LYQ134]|uniref:glycosyltransferase n=1 Tax=Marisediminicola sp. LYQ134 TaxID=3391061 RepID=UPI0039838050
MLRDELVAAPDVELKTFSWRSALLTRFDVFHAHWPENLLAGSSTIKSGVRRFLTLLLLVKLRVGRVAVVRTMHNLELPSGLSRFDDFVLRRLDAMTTLRIRLNDSTPTEAGRDYALIPHGHYRDWFGRFEKRPPVPGRLAYFGLIRRYKGVELLVERFHTLDSSFSLHIGGKPSSAEIRQTLEDAAGADDRISLDLRYLSDADLVSIATEAELVVLPYRFMHNSGGALAALSLGTPVLVPANDVNARLAAEVGSGWVMQYEGDLTSAAIEEAHRSATPRPPTPPDLSGRAWSTAGRDHVAAYRRAVALVGRAYSR